MTRRYNETAAMHYAAYRPPLHQRILKRALNDADDLSRGLDVGCGTGRSSIALADYCERLHAIDPSQSMLQAATTHPAITYMQGSAEHMPLPDQSIDVASFAGPLFYTDVDATVQEICRVCRFGALVIPYDFEVLFDDVLQRFGISLHGGRTTYDYSANFSGVSAFKEMHSVHERIQFDVSAADLAHIVLADSGRRDDFSDRYKTTLPHAQLAKELGPSDSRMTMVLTSTIRCIKQSAIKAEADDTERGRPKPSFLI